MKKSTPTSRAGSRTRPKDPNGPIPRYVVEVLGVLKMNQPQLAAALDVSKPSPNQWVSGRSHPSVENLLRLSQLSSVSLGRLSTLAALANGVEPPRLGDIEGRIAMLPDLLRGSAAAGVEAILSQAESAAAKLPKGTFLPPVANTKVEAFRAPTAKRSKT